MLFRTQGIIIKTFEYGEADLIVTFFTLDKGKVKGIAKGCRKTKSRFGSSLEPFTHSRISLYGKENVSLPKVTQSDILHSHRMLREDLSRLAYGAHISELIYEICPENEENRGVFDLLSYVLTAMESERDLELLSIFFDIRFLGLMGYQPRLDSCVRCSKEYGDLSKTRPIGKFFPDHGGILCERCSKPEEGFLLLTPETKDLYYKILSLPLYQNTFLEKKHPLSPQIRGELKTLISLHLNHILGKRLKSTDSLTWAI
ncbi:MAG: DNA repair protein RecO [Nitrospirota bacterium]